jgi:putative membrane-bound dehydrogenase-like protein
VKAPSEFQVTLYAAPPKVGYPVAIAAAEDGAVFVAVDEQGSLGRTAGGGKLLRCVDDDGDGKANRVNTFAKMEHPRGVVYHGGTAWVLHPPLLSAFHDDNRDGVSDRQEVLVTGLTTNQINLRGGDHTTNGIRMGIDGWLYIAVGDYGFLGAKGKDGTTLSQRGGGILRVRPDGTELEVFATGLRNPFDIAIDPYLNLFTRDNTNDGAGWDVRVSHLVQSAQYGYTQLYANFPDEIMPPLGQFGQGGGTGALFIQDPHWPERYRDTLYTGDWGRSEVYRHSLRPAGPTFALTQEVFLTIPRPTGMDIDAVGRLYVASWRGGEASVYVGPQVGFIACITPRNLKPEAPINVRNAPMPQVVRLLAAPNPSLRLQAQREILRRGPSDDATRLVTEIATDASGPLYGRVAAIFTLKQLDGSRSHSALFKLVDDPTVREFALRALTDRKSELNGLDSKAFVAALADESPRVRAQALVCLGRLNDPTSALSILPLAGRPKGSVMPSRSPIHGQPDPDRAIPHLAVRTLVLLNASDACLERLEGPYREGALRALRSMHDQHAVEGLIKKLAATRSPELRRELLTTLIRLYHREADYKGSWWGIRPDNTGPYYAPERWEQSNRIGSVITHALADSDPASVEFLHDQLARHRVELDGLPNSRKTRHAEANKAIVLPKPDPKNPDHIGNMVYEAAAQRALRASGDAAKGKALFDAQSCRSCHTDADGQTPKGPHLVEIGKRYRADELVESILKPSAKIAQGYEAYSFATAEGQIYTGFVVSEAADTVMLRESSGLERVLKQSEIEARRRQEQSAMPEGIVANLTPEELAHLVAYLQSLK